MAALERQIMKSTVNDPIRYAHKDCAVLQCDEEMHRILLNDRNTGPVR